MTQQERQQVLAVLQAARERIADPARWCRHSMAVDAEGRSPASLDDSRAVAWCAHGAVMVEAMAVGRAPWRVMDEAVLYLNDAARRAYDGPLTRVNDTRGHAAVLELYDTAIARAQRVLP